MDKTFEIGYHSGVSVFISLIEYCTSGAKNYHSRVQREGVIRAVACFLFIKPYGEACDYGGIDSSERNGFILSEELEPVKGRRIINNDSSF